MPQEAGFLFNFFATCAWLQDIRLTVAREKKEFRAMHTFSILPIIFSYISPIIFSSVGPKLAPLHLLPQNTQIML